MSAPGLVPTPTITIEQLPDALLGRIFELAAQLWRFGIGGVRKDSQLQGVPLVCRRWHHVFYSEPALWQLFRAPIWHDVNNGRLAVLRRAAPQVAAFRWRPRSGYAPHHDSLPAFLAALQPSRLVQLELMDEKDLPASALASMRGLTGLTRLSLDSFGKAAMQQALSLLPIPTLRCLQVKSLDEWATPQLPTQLEQLSLLTNLRLRYGLHSASCSFPLEPLTRLSKLRVLTLDVRRRGWERQPSTLQLPEPATFPGPLARYDITAKGIPFQVAGAQFVECRFDPRGPFALVPGDVNELRLTGISSMPSLPRLLDALLPPGLQLERLALLNSSLDAAALVGCTRLRHLQLLCIGQNFNPLDDGEPTRMASGTLAQALGALLQQAPRLRRLELSPHHHQHQDFQLGTVPECLVHCRHLTRLVLEQQGLSDLPAGDYLTGLRDLSLAYNDLTHLPPALSTATALERLDCNHLDAAQLSEEALATLRSLPHLRQLRLKSDPREWQVQGSGPLCFHYNPWSGTTRRAA